MMADKAMLTEGVYYILLSLTQPMHGYGIIQNVEKISDGRVKLAAGTLYGALATLLQKGWIAELPRESDSHRREYRLTGGGRTAVQQELCRLQELLDNGQRILGGMG